MAIYHFSTQIISKSQGRNAVACAAYRAASKLIDEKTGEIKDYSNKQGVVYSNILLCDNAPDEWNDREKLWNAVEKAEKRADAQLSREVVVALPVELNREQHIQLLEDYIQRNFIHRGMCADYSIHDTDTGNPHCHIMLTLRNVKKNGEFAPKSKQDYLLDENGERVPVIDPATGEQKLDSRNRKQWKRTTVPTNDWNEHSNMELWRENWANSCNQYLSAEQRIDHRSFERQGKERVPTIHEGYAARQIEARGGISEKCETNRQIAVINKAIEATEINAEATKKQIEAEARIAYNEETRKGKAAGDKYNKTLQKVYALYNNSTERLPAPFKTGFDNVDEYLDKIYAAHVKRTPEPARGTVRVISAAERQSWYEIGKLAGFPPAEIDRLFDVERFKPFSEKQLAYQSIKASREQFWREWKKKKAEIDRETNRAYKGRSKLRKAEWILHSKSPSWGQIIYAVIVLAKNRNAERDIELLKEVRDELYSDMREFKATTGATKSLLRDRDIRLDGYIEALRAAENKADRIYEQAEQEEKQNGYSALDELVRRAEAKKKPEQTNRPDKNKDHNLTY